MKTTKTLAIIIFTLAVIGCSSHKNKNTNTTKNSSAIEKSKAVNQIDFMGAYSLNDEEYGNKTNVTISEDKRILTTNALPNHKTGTFPNQGNPNTISAQDRTYEIPLNPTYKGEAKWVREPGVAINGVKFEPETAERFICETGQHYRIEAFQELVDLGLDFNHAHVQPTGAYHYHGVPTELIKILDKGEDLIHVGFANDGFPIYYSKSSKYKPSFQLTDETRTGDVCSYSNPKTTINKELNDTDPDGTFVSDWEYVEGLGDLDACNGININGKYFYLVTDSYPYVGRCLMGAFKDSERKGPPPRQRGEGGQGPHRHQSGSDHNH